MRSGNRRPTNSCRPRRPRSWPPRLRVSPARRVRRAQFVVTPFHEEERRAAGEYPNQSAGGEGLPTWTRQDRAIVDADIVLCTPLGSRTCPDRGLAGHARRVHRILARPRRLLRSQPRPRRTPSSNGRTLPWRLSRRIRKGIPPAGRGVPRDNALVGRRRHPVIRPASQSASVVPRPRSQRCSSA